jgi:hypothetical protein
VRLDPPKTFAGPRQDDVFPMSLSSILDPDPNQHGYVSWKHLIAPPGGNRLEVRETRESKLFPGYLERGPEFLWNDLYFKKRFPRHTGWHHNLKESEFAELNKRRNQNERHRQLRYLRNYWLHVK